MKRHLIYWAAGISAGLLSYRSVVSNSGPETENPAKKAHVTSPSKCQPTRAVGGAPSPQPEASQRPKLDQLKNKWSKMPPSDGNISQKHRDLAMESILELQCSAELMELIDYLRKAGRWDIETTFNSAMEKLLVSDRAVELRQSLAVLATQDWKKYKDRLLKWSYFAGIGCSRNELDDFCNSVGNPEVAQDAFFGWSLSLSKTDPKAAMTQVWQQMQKEISTPELGLILRRMVKKFPDGVDFSKLEAILPPDGQVQYGNAESARTELFLRWGASNPAAAANYVMRHPDRIKPGSITSVVSHLAKTDPHTAVAWIQQFPPGAYFDAAADGTLVYIASQYPGEARQLAEMIQNPGTRRENLAMIEGKLARVMRAKGNK